MTVWFVTPAWQRYELSAVCFDQRLDVIRALATAGIEARCVVVADDENLDLARARGFDTVEAPNVLSDKFNDGMEYAGKHGAQWIVPIGSDSWIDPGYLIPLPASSVSRTSPLYCAVTSARLAELRVANANGAGPYMLHRSRLAGSGFRPAPPGLMRYVDSATVRGLGCDPHWRPVNLHPYQYVGFRHPTVHITSYDKLWTAWGVAERADPWAVLAQHYPQDLVERARVALA